MKIFLDHLSSDEKEVLILENTLDIELIKFNAKLTAVAESTEIDLISAKNKVVMESGTEEDLAVLYEAAGDEAGEKKKGIFKKIIDSILTFLTNIKDKIKSIFVKEKVKELELTKQIQDVPVLDTINGKLNNILTEGKGMINKLFHGGDVKDEEIESFKEKALKVGVIGAGVTAATVTGGVIIGKVKKALSETDGAEGSISKIKSMIDSAKTGFNESKVGTILSAMTTSVKNAGSKLTSVISGLVNKVKGGNKSTEGNDNKDDKNNSNAVKESASDFDSFLNGEYTVESGLNDEDKKDAYDALRAALSIF